MPDSPRRVCTFPGCGEWQTRGSSRCAAHTTAAKSQYESERPTAKGRGYGRRWQGIRKTILRRDPFCTCDGAPGSDGRDRCRHGLTDGLRCIRVSNVADHYPLSRKQRLAEGLDPDALDGLRGLCTQCHNRHTGREQAGIYQH